MAHNKTDIFIEKLLNLKEIVSYGLEMEPSRNSPLCFIEIIINIFNNDSVKGSKKMLEMLLGIVVGILL